MHLIDVDHGPQPLLLVCAHIGDGDRVCPSAHKKTHRISLRERARARERERERERERAREQTPALYTRAPPHGPLTLRHSGRERTPAMLQLATPRPPRLTCAHRRLAARCRKRRCRACRPSSPMASPGWCRPRFHPQHHCRQSGASERAREEGRKRERERASE